MCNAQYTPRRRRRCEHNSQLAHDDWLRVCSRNNAADRTQLNLLLENLLRLIETVAN